MKNKILHKSSSTSMKTYVCVFITSIDENCSIRDTLEAFDMVDAYTKALDILNTLNDKVPKGTSKFEIKSIEVV